MHPTTVNELRQAYLDFFAKKHGHAVVQSKALLPENDPSTLFTGSGMQPMVPYLLGETHPAGTRIVNSQKCFRSQDIEEVGDNSHTTFFEMLGNWSLGDYFKQEQIQWIWEFLTQVVGLNPAQLYVTVFAGNKDVAVDQEAIAYWQTIMAEQQLPTSIGLQPEQDGLEEHHIFAYGDTKNWWSRAGVPEKMPVGEPGGPDSELFWDFGAAYMFHENSKWLHQPCHVNCDCGRFMEIGNNVFMAFKKNNNGFEELQNKNIDFGGGLERIAAAANNNPDVFTIDAFTALKTLLEQMSGKQYGADANDTFAFRVVLDHLRAATFLIADGAVPSNKDQGYFTRRLLRRAIRFASTIGILEQFCKQAGQAIIDTYKTAYPELLDKSALILGQLDAEEAQFRLTLTKGQQELERLLTNNVQIDGATVFYLYETFGFPKELTAEILQERTVQVVQPEQFEASKQAHSEKSRSAATGKFSGGLADNSAETTKLHTATHLLNAALRQVLGTHIGQKGSNITAERLRFDFNYEEKMTDEQKKEVERLVNEAIAANLPISYHMATPESAKAEGAIGVFDDRYDAQVKVYRVGPSMDSGRDNGSNEPFSLEICGGPHVANTAMLGHFTLQKEESSSAGIRRIKAVVTGGPAEITLASEA